MNAKLFGKWSYLGLECPDPSLEDHICIKGRGEVYVPHTAGRWQGKRFHKILCPISERLVTALMFHGRNNGKKLMAVTHVKHAFELIHLQTDDNPLQILINAICNAGPREDSCRVGSAGVVRLQAVDVSPMRRVNQAIYRMVKGTRNASFRSIKTFPECLAEEIIATATKQTTSSSNKKKQEIESKKKRLNKIKYKKNRENRKQKAKN
jgi:small subunit ribosomal protein S5e